jgi:hypothetical protein
MLLIVAADRRWPYFRLKMLQARNVRIQHPGISRDEAMRLAIGLSVALKGVAFHPTRSAALAIRFNGESILTPFAPPKKASGPSSVSSV